MNSSLKETLKEVVSETSDGTPRIIFDGSKFQIPELDKQFQTLVQENPTVDVVQMVLSEIYKMLDSRYFVTTVKWDDLVGYGDLPYILDVVNSELVTSEKEEELLKEERNLDSATIDVDESIISYEEAKTRALQLDIDADLAQCKKVGLGGKRALIYNAYTGSGKSLGLDMWIANSDPNLQSGIILTHDNAEAQMHYKRITTWNPSFKDKIFVYNTAEVNRANYRKVREDLSLLSQYNWIICYQGRLLDSNVDVLSGLMKILEDKKKLFNLTRTYIFSDERIPSAVMQVISAQAILAIEEHSNHALLNFAKDPNEYNKLKISEYFASLNDRLENDQLTEQDINVVELFTSKRIKNSSPMSKRIYMARYKTLLNYIANRSEHFLEAYNKVINGEAEEIRFYPRIDEVALQHDLIIFDATARIDYGDDNPYFTIKTLVEQPKNVLDFHIMEQQFPERGTLTKEQFDQFFVDLKNNGFRFNDYSLIIWNASPWNYNDDSELEKFNGNKTAKRTYSKTKLDEFLIDTLGKDHHCIVTYFNSSNMLGKNIFSHCKNVYILGEYRFHESGLHEAQAAMLNFHYNNKYKWLSEVIQGIGRGALRLQKTEIPDEDPGVMNIYLSDNIPNDVILTLLNYYDTQSNRILWNTEKQFNKWIGVALANAISGPLQDLNKSECRFMDVRGKGRSNIDKVKHFAKLFLSGVNELNIQDLVEENLISKPELNRANIALRTFKYLGINLTLYRGKGKRRSEINSLRCF